MFKKLIKDGSLNADKPVRCSTNLKILENLQKSEKHDFHVHHVGFTWFEILRNLPVLLVLICLVVGWQLAHWRHWLRCCKIRNLIAWHAGWSFYRLTYCFYPDRIFSVDLNLKKWTPFKNYHINIKSENKNEFFEKLVICGQNSGESGWFWSLLKSQISEQVIFWSKMVILSFKSHFDVSFWSKITLFEWHAEQHMGVGEFLRKELEWTKSTEYCHSDHPLLSP